MLFNSVYQNYSDMGEAYADCFGSKIQSVVAQSPAADQQHAATTYNVQRQKQTVGGEPEPDHDNPL